MLGSKAITHTGGSAGDESAAAAAQKHPSCGGSGPAGAAPARPGHRSGLVTVRLSVWFPRQLLHSGSLSCDSAWSCSVTQSFVQPELCWWRGGRDSVNATLACVHHDSFTSLTGNKPTGVTRLQLQHTTFWLWIWGTCVSLLWHNNIEDKKRFIASKISLRLKQEPKCFGFAVGISVLKNKLGIILSFRDEEVHREESVGAGRTQERKVICHSASVCQLVAAGIVLNEILFRWLIYCIA